MYKILLLVIAALPIVSCQQRGSVDELKKSVTQTVSEIPPVVEDPMDNYRDACAEISQTRMFEGSKRVDILKTVGGLSSQQAANANELVETSIEYTSQVMSKMQELANALNSDSVRDVAPNLMSPECYDEALVLNNNVCMLAVLTAVEDGAPASQESASGELTMRVLRIKTNECEQELTDSIVPAL